MKVKDIMKTEIYTAKPDATLKEVVELLLKYKISGLIVVDDKDSVVGVVSEKDVYRVLYPSYRDFYQSPELFTDFKKQEEEIQHRRDLRVEEFMSQDVIHVNPDDYVMKVGALMLAKNIHRMPVIDTKGKLVGVISRGRIYRSLFKKQLGLK